MDANDGFLLDRMLCGQTIPAVTPATTWLTPEAVV